MESLTSHELHVRWPSRPAPTWCSPSWTGNSTRLGSWRESPASHPPPRRSTFASSPTPGSSPIEPRGRQRLVALSGADVARAIEALTEIAPAKQVRGLAGAERNNALRTARTCYDHPAGALGVALTARLVDDGIVAELEPGTIGTMLRTGHPTLDSLGVTIPTGGRRPTVRSCLDWTERRPHVAGALGRAVLDALVEGKWVSRRRDTRALRVTPSGADRLGELLGDWTPAGT